MTKVIIRKNTLELKIRKRIKLSKQATLKGIASVQHNGSTPDIREK